jgi:transketolase
MDPIVVAFGTALVGAVATDTWQKAKDAVTGLWGRVRPDRAEGISTELDALRQDVLEARRDGNSATEQDLEEIWQRKVQQLLRQNPTLAAELQRVLDTVLTPALPAAEQGKIQAVITGTASGNAHLNQAGRDVNVIGGDSYTAGRDQHIRQP